jgi:cation:H+ antiporter
LASFLFVLLGLTLLLVGGASLVKGASGIAQAFNVPSLIIGLTVVAFGTSAPELVINVTGALQGKTDLAFGNAVGSNLANFGLVLGLAAIMSPIYLQGQVIRREVPFLLLITAILLVMVWDEPLSGTLPLLDRGDAIILFLLFTVFVYFMVRDFINEEDDPLLVEGDTFSSKGSGNGLVNWVLLLIGLVLLVVGGEMTIDNGVAVAEIMGVSEVVIGMFVLAVGTSLPELITSGIAAYKKETDLALGNIVGSNIFNSLVVLPAAAIIRPLPIPEGGDWDLAVGGLFVLVLIPLFLFSRARLGRLAGIGLISGYFLYLYLRFNF